jgi:hypothetical protein
MADWRELYKAAVLETNPTQLERLVTESEDAIFLRRRVLAVSKKERRKMAEASAALWTLTTGKLGLTDRKAKSV